MIRLLKIGLLKLATYRVFLVTVAVYAFFVLATPAGIVEFLRWLKSLGFEFGNFNPLNLPILFFPDIWQNMTYLYSIIKVLLALTVVVSVTNEFTNRTIRQNIIDGLSRQDFIWSKMLVIALLSTLSGVLVFLTGTITGLVYTPEVSFMDIWGSSTFVLAHVLDVFAFLMLAFLFAVLFRKAVLSIVLLVAYLPIEYIIASQLPYELKALEEYLPLHAINNVIESPFARYLFQEIQDEVSLWWALVAIVYSAGFMLLIQWRLKWSDL